MILLFFVLVVVYLYYNFKVISSNLPSNSPAIVSSHSNHGQDLRRAPFSKDISRARPL